MNTTITLSTILLLGAATSGCAVLVPNSVRPEFEHLSHLTQHQPFTDDQTHYGADIANVVLHWDLPKRLTFELAEGIVLEKHWSGGAVQGNGEIEGPREQFTARIGYVFTIH